MLFSLVLHLFFLTENIYADEGVNFALGKPTWQSSTEADGVSSRAVDGYKHPHYSENSCMQTKTQYEPWWAVDLEREIFVTAIRITNRVDCCWTDFDIRIGANLTDGGKRNSQCGPTYTDHVGGARTVTINCGPPLLGRFVTVSITEAEGTLNFCELEVYGYHRENVFSVKAISYGTKNYTDLGRLSQLIVDDTYNETFVNWGHYVISFDMTTGQKIAQKHFDTQNDSSALTKMPVYLQNLRSEIFVFVILNRAGWKYYQTSIPVLGTLSGRSNISDQLTWGDAWALLGYKGILPSPSWRNSVTKNTGHSPAIIEDVIPKLSVPPALPSSSIVVVDLTSSSFTIRWSRPPDIVTENELPLKYTVCVSEPVSMADGSVVNASTMVNSSLVMVNSTVSNSTLVNDSMVHDTVDKNCESVGDATSYTMTGLRPQTDYVVSVKAHSFAGFGPETAVHVATMKNDSREIYVELVSRIGPDVSYRLDAQPYSSITIGGQQHNFVRHGFNFIVLHPKTGSQVMQRSFNTLRYPSSSTQMAEFLSTVPKPSIILMVVYHQANLDRFPENAFLLACPNAPSSYTKHESWSMICLYGFGSMPWVTSLRSDAKRGPAVIKTHILLPKDLESAPNLTSVVATSSETLKLSWTVPMTDNYTGDISYYQICYQRSSTPTDSGCSLVSAGSNLTEVEINGLLPYREYRVKIRGVVALGYGPYSDVLLQTTLEAEPIRGPQNIRFPRKNGTSILVTWLPPKDEDRNGVIQRYSVCHKLAKARIPCINYTVTDNMWLEVNGLKPYRYIQFLIKAATSVGFGPTSTAFQYTSQTAPGGPPTEARTIGLSSDKLTLSWLPPDPELHNGIIINYFICLRVVSTSPGPCLREMTHVLGGQDDPLTKFTVSELKPYTKYGFNISAGTVVGFGPPALVVVTTRETAPSGPPADIQVANFTHNEMNITWSPPDPSKRNGVITKYSLCIRNQTYGFCLHEDTFEFTQTSYTFSGLRPYRVYSVTIRAATVKGFGPIGSITRRTAQSEPDGPPMEKIVKYIDESTISFSWTEPHPELHNGIIIYYHVCIRKYGPDFSCTRTAQIPRQNEKSYAYGGLSPSNEYVVVIRAATIIGLGPAAFIQKTAGVCDLPVLNTAGDYVSNDSFTASGFLGRRYGPHQSPIDSDFPWCDSGLKNNAYMQIDFGGPLRVIGFATRRHKDHWDSWVSSYKVSHSLDSMEWNFVNVGGEPVLDGNADTIKGREVTHFIDEPVLTRFIRFEVQTFVGAHSCMSVQVFGCAPAMKPMTTSVLNTTAHSIQVSWTPLPSQVNNGRIFGYKICYKIASARWPCQRLGYVDHNATSYTVNELIPYTEYAIEISAGTIAGFGPSVLLTATTNESIPSGPPLLLKAQDITATSLRLMWSPPEQNHANGIIRLYGVCYQEASLGTECTEVINVPGGQLAYEITQGLRPYTEHVLVVMAATKIKGWSPKAVLNITTLLAAPYGPPTSVYATRIGSRILQIFWKPPEPRKRNGDIVGYRLCIKEKRSSQPCRDYVTFPESQMNMHSCDGLKPFTMYNIHVEAKTAIGYGPGQYLDYRSGEAAPTAPPKDVIFKSVTTTSIEITWSPPDEEKQNGIIAMYEIEMYQEMSGSIVEKVTKSLMRVENTTVWKIAGLSPRTDYIFHIRAGTTGGFGPAVIVHKRSGGRFGQTDKSTGRGKNKLTTEGIAGGSILLIALIAGFVFSILWNKGMLPRTRTRKLRRELQKEERRHRRRERRKRKKMSEPGTEIHITHSVCSELDDLGAPTGQKREVQQRIAAENLSGTDGVGIYSTGATNALTPDIYGTSSAPPGQDIYDNTPPGIEIHGTADPGGGIGAVQKSNTILPPIVPKSSALPSVIPLETALSSVFIKLSSTVLNDPGFNTNADPSSRPKTRKNPSRNPNSPRSSPVPPKSKGKRKKNTRSPKPTVVIPEPSKFTPVVVKQKIAPVVKVDTVGSDFTGPTFPSTSMENDLSHPVSQPSINTDPITDTVIESFYSVTDIAGSDVVPVSILRATQGDVHNYPVPPTDINSNHISNIPIFRGNASVRRQSLNYHPNMPRYSIDFSASPQNLNNTCTHKLPPIPAYPSYPKLNSETIIYQPSDTHSK